MENLRTLYLNMQKEDFLKEHNKETIKVKEIKVTREKNPEENQPISWST